MRASPCLGLVALLAACGPNRTFPGRQPYEGDGPAPLSCLPDLDGRIEARELAPALGPSVAYLVSPPGAERPVDLAGAVDGEGRRVWDWSTDLADDRLFRAAASGLAGKWYADAFPADAYAAPLDAAGATEGVYRADAAALQLLGVASREESPPEGRTLYVYREPVALFRFPLEPGAAWTSVGEVRDATLRGLPHASRDTYEVRVDAVGTLELPDFTFTQVHRVRTLATLAPAAGVTTTQRQVSFLFECLGEVARATSRPGETAEDFAVAAEVRRLGLE